MSAAAPLDADALLERAVVRLVDDDGWPAEDAVNGALAHLKATGRAASEIGIARAREVGGEAERERRRGVLAEKRRRDQEHARTTRAARKKAIPAIRMSEAGAVERGDDEATAHFNDLWTEFDARAELRRPMNMPSRVLRSFRFEEAAEFTPPHWLVKHILPKAGLALLYGESSGGKTFLCIHAALAVAWGLPFFGKRTKRGGVLYVAAEAGASVGPRIRAANAKLQEAAVAANIARSEGAPLLKRAPLEVVTEAPNLSRDGDPKALLKTVGKAHAAFADEGGLALIVIDTWHSILGGGDENAAADAGHALRPLKEIAEKLGVLVLVVHHPGKSTEKGARGTNSLPAAADTCIELTVPDFEGPKPKPAWALRKGTVVKQRDGEVGAHFHYKLHVTTLGEDEDGEPWTTCTVDPQDAPVVDDDGLTKPVRALVDAVRSAGGEGARATLEEARLRFYSAMGEKSANAKRQAWRRALREARAAGRIMTDDHDVHIWIPDPAEEA